jgi:hypothetical protein
MNQRDWELLDKQLWGFSSRPPQNSGLSGACCLLTTATLNKPRRIKRGLQFPF